MTRASLLHILDNLGGISETEVQELEQLAATFPYCQTAHLLLAKAAHDRGSMLAAQRLRRAATYAVNRQRLRALIELPTPVPSVALVAPADATRVETTPVLLAIAPPLDSVSVKTNAPEQSEPILHTTGSELELLNGQPISTVNFVDTPQVEDISVSSAEEVVAEDAVLEAASQEDATSVNSEEKAPQIKLEDALAAEISLDASVSQQWQPVEHPDTQEQIIGVEKDFLSETKAEVIEVEPNALITEAATSGSHVGVDEPELEVPAEFAEPVVSATQNDTEQLASETEEDLPAVSPPIRTPAEAGSSRFEFGLAEATPIIPTYNLFDAEKAPAKPAAVPPFWADQELGYAPGLGSRLGYCLQMQDEYTLDLPPSAFFAPDALLLQHLQQHQPVLPPVPTSIDLIDKFLRSKPRFKAPLPLPPTTEAQADLSVRSTVAEPGLASESLARILVRQGKIAKAIEIYERLMVRQPEKKAYFADQIQQLQTFE